MYTVLFEYPSVVALSIQPSRSKSALWCKQVQVVLWVPNDSRRLGKTGS